ncbi:MAG: hypothetical protein ACREH9_12450, partial [Pseudomonadota bacterium]
AYALTTMPPPVERIMSIYGGRKSWKDFSDAAPKAVNARAPDTTSPDADPAQDEWSAVRKATPANYLLPATRKWYDTLPADVAPMALAVRFPRIANLVAAQWTDRRTCPLLFEDLLGDRRGGRDGFAPDVRRDLLRLQECWYGGRAAP